MYVYHNIKACSCNHWCSGKAISITYTECACVASGIQHAIRMRRIVIRFYNIFSHYLINGTIFEKKSERKMGVLIFSIQLFLGIL